MQGKLLEPCLCVLDGCGGGGQGKGAEREGEEMRMVAAVDLVHGAQVGPARVGLEWPVVAWRALVGLRTVA